MIPSKKVQSFMVSSIQRRCPIQIIEPLYKMCTLEHIYIFKSTDGMWRYGIWDYWNPEIFILSDNKFFQKMQIVEYIEKNLQPRVTFEGKERIYTAKQAVITKNKNEDFTFQQTGYTAEYWDNFTNSFVDQLLIRAKETFKIDLELDRTVSFANSWKARKSFAAPGTYKKLPKIFIRLASYMHKKNEKYHFCEYDHIKHDSDIGEFYSDDFHDIVKALVCHEVAHSIHQKIKYGGEASITNYKNYKDTSSKRSGDHGSVWQSIYFNLRTEFLPRFSGVGC